MDAGEVAGDVEMEPAQVVTELSKVRIPTPELNGISHDGAGRLLQEVIDAVEQGKPQNDLLPLQYVIESWHRCLLLMQHDPKAYEETTAKARRSHPTRGLSDAEVQTLLGIDPD